MWLTAYSVDAVHGQVSPSLFRLAGRLQLVQLTEPVELQPSLEFDDKNRSVRKGRKEILNGA